ncbi:GTP 3',8-cyclase [subsurface metagenome]
MDIERKIEIDFDSTISIDKKYVVKEYSKGILLFFYNMPNWVVFSQDEINTFKALENSTVGKVIEHTSMQDVKDVLRKLFSREILRAEKEKANHTLPKILPMHIYLTNNCNLKCIHCYMYAGKPLRDELSFEDWKGILAGFIEYGGKELTISGGEPLLVSFFSEFVKCAKERKPSLHIKLLTNGTLLYKLSIDFLNRYIDELQISIDGPTVEINDRVRGNGHFMKTMNNLVHIQDFKGGVTISMCVLDTLIEPFANDFGKFYQEVIKLIPKVKFGIATDLMDGRNYKRLNYDKAKRNLEVISNIFNDAVKKFDMEGQEEKKFERNVKTISCGYGATLTVTANGYIYPCGVIYGQPLGFYKEKAIAEFANELEGVVKQYDVDNLPICRNCILKYVCGGTCRIENHKINGEITVPICIDAAKKDIFDSIYKDDLEFET